MPRGSLHATLNSALDRLHGIVLPEHCVRLARDEASGEEGRRTYRHTPLLALLAFFARPVWVRELRQNMELREGLFYVLDRVAHQLEMADPRDRARTAWLACRAARRYLLLLTLRPDLADLECCAEHVEEIAALPVFGGVPGSECIPRGPACIAEFLKALRGFQSGAPILGRHAGSRERVDETFEKFDDRHFLRGRFAGIGSTRWSCVDPLRPVVVGILRECRSFLAAGVVDREQAGHYLVALLCIFYGFDYRDALVLRVGRPPTSAPGPGFFDLPGERLVRRIGSGFYPGDGAFSRSELSLPLVPEVAELVARLELRADGVLLREQLGLEAHVDYVRWLRRWKRSKLARMKLGTTGLHLTFDFVALFKCELYACELSLLRAAPRYGAAAECSYVCMAEEELTGRWHEVVAVIRRWAGLPAWRGTVAEPAREHGTPSMLLTAYVEMVREHIRGATCRNELLAALEGLFRCLGRRNSLRHENAATCVRGYPEPVLQLVDKWRNGRPLGVRYLPMVAAVEMFAELCAKQGGGGRLLAYEMRGGGWGASDKAGGRLGHWLHVGRARQAARTAFFNEMRRRRVPAVVLNAAMGHSAELTWESALLPIPNAVLLARLRGVLDAVLEECGFAAAVEELRMAFEQWSAEPAVVGGGPRAGGPASSVLAPFTPLTEIEDFLGCRIVANLERELLPATGWATAVYGAMQLGLPFRLLVRNASYATFRCILSDEATGRAFFFAPIEGPDVGHLDFFPVEIPKESVFWRHLLARWRELRSDHVLPRACLDAPIFGEAKNMSDKVGKYVSRLATDGRRLRLDDSDAVRLLERLSAAQCRHWQCGSAAGALALEIPTGLNQIAVVETISRMTGVPAVLRDLNGGEWTGRLFHRRGRRVVSDRERRTHYEKFLDRLTYARWPGELADEAEQAEYLYELFWNERVTVGKARFHRVATLLGSPEAAAARVATLAMRLAHRHGALEPSRSESFPTDAAMRSAGERVAARELDIRHKDPAVSVARTEDTARSLEMLMACGCRLSESILTLPSEFIEEEEWTAHYIYESKTDAGRRMVLPDEFAEESERRAPRMPQCEWNRRNRNLRKKHHQHYVDAERVRLQRQVRAILGAEYHPHSLRHYRAYVALVALFTRKEHNGAQMLASLARMFGHASALTFLNAYVGTLLACFAVRPEPLPMLGKMWMTRCETRLRGRLRLETQLRDEYSGCAGARAAIWRERRAFEALRHREHGQDGDLQCWDLRAEREEAGLQELLKKPTTRVVRLPAAPELPEYWEALAIIWTRALAVGISVVVDMPRAMQRDWGWKVESVRRAVG